MYNLQDHNILAVSRSDNTIELWSTKSWIQLLKIPGMKSYEIRKIFLTKSTKTNNPLENLRVFSISLNGSIVEWCLNKLIPKITYNNPSGGLWDCAITKSGEFCILACDDGAPRKIQIEDRDIFLAKQYTKNDSKILCVTIDPFGEKYFYTGNSNGHLIKWDIKTGEQILTFNIAASKLEKNKN